MGVVLTGNGSSDTKQYERPEAAVYAARCIQIIDLGTHTEPDFNDKTKMKDSRKLKITWELNELMSDGRPFVVSWDGNMSFNEKSNLYKMLVSWRGKAFTEEEKKKFELKNILDKPCMLNVTVNEKGYNKVAGVMPLPKGMTLNDRFNPLVDFSIDMIGTELFASLPNFVKDRIWASHEGVAFGERDTQQVATATATPTTELTADQDEVEAF